MDPSPRTKKRNLILFAFALIFLAAAAAVIFSLNSWNAPASARRLNNPVPATESAVDEGMFVYSQHCKDCHGEDGNGQGAKARDGGEKDDSLLGQQAKSRNTGCIR